MQSVLSRLGMIPGRRRGGKAEGKSCTLTASPSTQGKLGFISTPSPGRMELSFLPFPTGIFSPLLPPRGQEYGGNAPKRGMEGGDVGSGVYEVQQNQPRAVLPGAWRNSKGSWQLDLL